MVRQDGATDGRWVCVSGRRREWFKLTYNARGMLHTLHHRENAGRAASGKEPLTLEAYLEALIGHYFGDELGDRVDRMKAEGRYAGNAFDEEWHAGRGSPRARGQCSALKERPDPKAMTLGRAAPRCACARPCAHGPWPVSRRRSWIRAMPQRSERAALESARGGI